MTPTHDAYLDNGTDLGLTVGSLIIAYSSKAVNIPENIDRVFHRRRESGKGNTEQGNSDPRCDLCAGPYPLSPGHLPAERGQGIP